MNKNRLSFIRIITVLFCIILIIRLAFLQIKDGKAYLDASNQRAVTTIKKKAPRGDIKDRNGKTLVTNREGYSLLWIKTTASDETVNTMLKNVLDVLKESEYQIEDSFPISLYPYEFTFKTQEEKTKWFQDKKKLNEQMSAVEVLEYYQKAYNVTDVVDNDTKRQIIGIRYDAQINGHSYSNPYCFAKDVDINTVTKIKERKEEFQDIEVLVEYFRQYEYASLASHILGRVGKIYKEEYETLREKGYSYNDVVGKQGIEKICEDELRGQDGTTILTNFDVLQIPGISEKEAVPGNYAVLTIDSDLQMVVEQSLKNTVDKIRENGQGKGAQKGADANAGSAVVMDVRNGEILAMASYPSYNPEVYNKEYNTLLEDEAKPLWNRAICGTYAPGSTFKPLTAIAALQTGAVSETEEYYCDGVYKYFNDYQPKCWIYLDAGRGHGWESVVSAIEDSCNLYFYEAGRKAGIDALSKYAKMFGLGEYTGIELEEEAKGQMANEEIKEELGHGQWYGGDTIQAAIGQSYSKFSPLQLVNYVSTIANGGKLFKPHLIKSINSTTDSTQVKTMSPQLKEKVDVDAKILETVKRGMYGVVDEGSASKVFENYPVQIGGKTGTAQGNKNESNTALFVAFAPYDKPEIAVAVVIEHGVRGVNAATVAKDVFDEYFSLEESVEKRFDQGELLP